MFILKSHLYSLIKKNLVVFIAFFLALFTIGCVSSSNSPKDFSILPFVPMEYTEVPSYLQMKTVFESDEEIVLLISWKKVKTSENHILKWDIVDSQDDILFSKIRENFTSHPNMYTYCTVPLESELKDRLNPGELTANFYIDNVLAMSKKIMYESKKIVNKTGRKIVILPFIEKCDHPSPWNEKSRNYFQNTISYALYVEIKRIFPDTTPHYVTEQKIGNVFKPVCFNDKECTSFMQGHFGDSIFIYGDLWIQRAQLDASILNVIIFDSISHTKKRFHFSHRYLNTFSALMNDLLEGVMYKEGALDYLKTYN
ncbi:MAG: hypothetical protein KKE44_13305 [Proteobacteria bacterium]|nr:hypothetical protein [Pseudomonadota bacterium]MBU1583704.1 hypothetical protein [Pseudomonadota bacterium]MBU2453866.1 hypothetical protein [Pseudomonadota bacterium]